MTFSKRLLVSKLYPKKIELFERLNTNKFFVTDVLNKTGNTPCFNTREEMYDFINKEYIAGNQFDYLEFGVFEGAAIKRWSELNKNPDSRFYGFDSFKGLPEDLNSIKKKGSFNVNGKIPEIEDRRVEFIKGWFHESLPQFLKSYRKPNKLVIHIDADLYSSTLFCLTKLDEFILKDTIVIFDEFYDLLHEFLAFHDYTKSYYKNWEIVALTNKCVQVAVIFK